MLNFIVSLSSYPFVYKAPQMTDHAAIEAYLSTLSPAVQRAVKPVSGSDIQQDFMLHISTNPNIPSFIPSIGRRQQKNEDRTVPRICVAPSILGCIASYSKVQYDVLTCASSGKEEDEGYLGGWVIYALDFEHCLKPNKSLVPDIDCGDEHWLVGYSPETAEYKPRIVGRIFCDEMYFTAKSKNLPQSRMRLQVEITGSEDYVFSKNIKLTKGYWEITGPVNDLSWQQDSDFRVNEIEKALYQERKALSAALLSYGDVPPSLKW